MRGFVPTLLLAIFAFFLLSAAWDECAFETGGCPPSCHASCPDGCAAAPLPPPPASAAQAAPRQAVPLLRGLELPPSYLTQPETPPPRS